MSRTILHLRFFFFLIKIKVHRFENKSTSFIYPEEETQREDAKQNRRSNLNQRGKEEKG